MKTNSNILIFDIETVANPQALAAMPEPKAPANLKDPEKIRAAIEEKKAEAVERAALDPDTATIKAISWCNYSFSKKEQDYNAVVIDESIDDKLCEKDILTVFWQLFKDSYGRAAGYNIINFDLPFILRRSFALGVNPTIIPNMAKYRTEPITDLYGILYGWQPGKGLKTVCKLYGIPVPAGDVDGSQVARLDTDALYGYAISDVIITTNLFEKMNGIYF